MTLYMDYGTPPEVVDRMDPEFIDELMIRRMAEADHKLFSRKPAKDGDEELKKTQAKRRAAIAKWRDEERKRR